MSIAIVSDSTADIPAELATRLGIHVVPNILIIDGKSLEDGAEISRESFYQQLPYMESLPSTATASSGAYEALYSALLENGTSRIISIHAASQLSGIFNAVSSAAQQFNDRVDVVDSGQVSMGLGFQALAAAEAAGAGASPAEVLEAAQSIRRRVRLVAMLDTLEYVRRSGRVSWARARIGELLQIKPFISLEAGHVNSLGEARTRRKGIARLLKFLQDLGPLERLAVLHTNAEEEACQFLSELQVSILTQPIIVNVTTVIGTHVGPKALGFVAVPVRSEPVRT